MLYSIILTAALQAAWVAADSPSPPSGFTTTWSDEFNGASGTLPDAANWIFDLGTSYPGGAAQFGTGEVETMTNDPANVAVNGDGVLEITPLRDSTGAWTSARIETVATNFTAEAGKIMQIEARISMPSVTGTAAIGYWPAFWTLGSAFRGIYTNWPIVGEFDIMENINGLDLVSGTLHCGVDPGGPCSETDGITGNTTCVGSTCTGNFHTYALVVDRSGAVETITWLVDGVSYHSVSSSVMDAATWSAAVDDSKFIVLNVAIGGSFPNKVYGSTTPLDTTTPGFPMSVDYVAVYNN
jgi:beta-glucanase (GH16 family)